MDYADFVGLPDVPPDADKHPDRVKAYAQMYKEVRAKEAASRLKGQQEANAGVRVDAILATRVVPFQEVVSSLQAQYKQPTLESVKAVLGEEPTNWIALEASLKTQVLEEWPEGPVVILASGSKPFAALLTMLKDGAGIKAVLDSYGEVPKNWDQILGHLFLKGHRFPYKVGASSLQASYLKGGAEVPVLKDLVAEGFPLYAAKKIMAMARLGAGAPTKPMPTDDPGEGMAWAWDGTAQNWYITQKSSGGI